MAWERRERGSRYYTRSRKVAGRVVREYIGTGPTAEAIATLDALDREQRRLEAEAWREEREAVTEARQSVRELAKLVDDLTVVELERRGFHRHKGQWRRQRGAAA